MNKQRPVNLNIDIPSLPITSYVSFLHRISGLFLFAGTGLLIWMLGESLQSAQGFAELQEFFAAPLVKLVLWLVLVALIYHTLAGIRHLFMDFGIGESYEGGVLGAQLTLIGSAIVALLAGWWLW